jgi:hypothetical protein
MIEAVHRYQQAGAAHHVFDLRARFRDFEECIGTLGEEVLPALHREEGRESSVTSP